MANNITFFSFGVFVKKNDGKLIACQQFSWKLASADNLKGTAIDPENMRAARLRFFDYHNQPSAVQAARSEGQHDDAMAVDRSSA